VAITNITSLELKRSVVDEIHIRERVDSNINLSSSKDSWQIDTFLLAKFMGNLEAGNIGNNGIELVSFAVKRRKLTETTSVTLGYLPFEQSRTLELTDSTQTSDDYIYSIVPISNNGLEGKPSEVFIKSEFAGWFIYDREEDRTLSFDKYMGSENYVDKQFNQNRVQINTLSPFPQIYRTPEQYHTFSLSTIILADEWTQSGKLYENILNNFILKNKPFLVKGSDGSLYVCDIGNIRTNTPQNAYRGRDFMEVTIDAVEIMKYEDYMNESVGG
jgi:hypothetical protein